ncbi:MAG: signal peptide peptidase SppA [Rickettsiales bacterium]
MALNADTLIDRSYLKGQIAKWRLIAILVVVLSAILLLEGLSPITPRGNYIARVTIEGIITDDLKRDELFGDLIEDDSVKAVILRVDSPGGTVVGGEQLYLNVKKLASKKPVVVTMRSMATSAAYMASLGADQIFAQRGTLTGSVGVLMQTAEITDMAEKLGIEPIVIKSGEHKAAPNPLEKLTVDQREVIKLVTNDFFRVFVGMVAENRDISQENIALLSDGRVFTGPQAKEIGLVDAIGGEEEAIQWLEENKGIESDINVEDRKPHYKKQGGFGSLFDQMAKIFTIFPQIQLDGLVSIWQPKPM